MRDYVQVFVIYIVACAASFAAGCGSPARGGLSRDASSAWRHYNRGSELATQGSVDEGLQELREAERLFPGIHEKSLAVYRRAMALDSVHRCADARREFSLYISMIQATEPDSVVLAKRVSDSCQI